MLWEDPATVELCWFGFKGGILTVLSLLTFPSWESARLNPGPRLSWSVFSSLACGRPLPVWSEVTCCSTDSFVDMFTFWRPHKIQVHENNSEAVAKFRGSNHVFKICAVFLFSRGDTGGQPTAVYRRVACRSLYLTWYLAGNSPFWLASDLSEWKRKS